VKKALFLILVIVSSQSFSQFSTTEKKGKTGLKFEDQLIVKPKFDSINTTDKEIATAYKKSSIYYLNNEGKKIKKSAISYGSIFTDGFAIISTKKGRYGAINNVGEKIIRFSSKEMPQQFGRLLIVKSWSDYNIYSPSGYLSGSVDSVDIIEDWLLGHKTEAVYHHYIRKRTLGKDKDESYYTYHPYFNIHNYRKGTAVLKNVVRYYQDENYTIHKLIDSSVAIVDNNDQLISKGDYIDIQVNKNSLYCTLLNDSAHTTEIRDLSGKLLRNDLLLINTIDEFRYVFQNDSLQFIGDEMGKQLSPKMTGFGDLTNGWRIAYDKFSFTYMNDSTYEVLTMRLPVILKTITTSSGGGNGGWSLGRGIRNFKTRVGNIAKKYTGGTERALETSEYAYIIKKDEFPVYQFPIQGEYVIVVSSLLDSNQSYDRFFHYEYNFEPKFNYMKTDGSLINNEHYDRVESIINDRFIAGREKKDVVVSLEGSELTHRFDRIRKDTLGYYVTRLDEYPTRYGLLDSNLNEVLPCKYGYFSFLEDGFYEVDYKQRKKLRYKIPE
jgi:hypothetical protein